MSRCVTAKLPASATPFEVSIFEGVLTPMRHQKTSVVGGLLRRYDKVTSPPKWANTGINRVGYDVGRFGLPILGAYGAGRLLGLWGDNPSGLVPQWTQQVRGAQAPSFDLSPSPGSLLPSEVGWPRLPSRNL